jgi:hypothetical protein
MKSNSTTNQNFQAFDLATPQPHPKDCQCYICQEEREQLDLENELIRLVEEQDDE